MVVLRAEEARLVVWAKVWSISSEEMKLSILIEFGQGLWSKVLDS